MDFGNLNFNNIPQWIWYIVVAIIIIWWFRHRKKK